MFIYIGLKLLLTWQNNSNIYLFHACRKKITGNIGDNVALHLRDS